METAQHTPHTNILSRLNRPYVMEASVAKRWILSAMFGGFVFIFLLVFQPFGLNTLERDITIITLGYGLTTFIVMSLLNVALIPLFPGFFNEEKWTVGKELFWSLMNIALIGLANVAYSAYIDMVNFGWRNVLVFELYTLAIGLFPIGANVLLKESRLNKLFSSQSENINVELDNIANAPKNAISDMDDPRIKLRSENANDDIEIRLNELFFVKAADNYVEVHYVQNGQGIKKLIRASLKSISSDLVGHTQLFRCHKSYIVNLKKVTQVSGNAQGYKLHLPGIENPVPVSRQFNEEIKVRLCG